MIKDFHLNEVVSDYFLVNKCEIATSSAGKPYGRLVLEDASGTITAMMWDNVQQIQNLESGQIVHAQFLVSKYKDTPQAKITSISLADPANVSIDKLIATSQFNCDDMLSEIIEIAKTIEDPWYAKLVHYFYSDPSFLKRFRNHPAAVGIHHAYCGGLLQHTLFVTKNSRAVAANYDNVSMDLVTTVALLHDIGKLHELQALPSHDFTNNGNFIGHVVEGQNMIRDACKDIDGFPDAKRDVVCHCILAHHGELEFGSPVKPSLIEAFIVNACDQIDAKSEIFAKHLNDNEAQLQKSGFTSKSSLLGVHITDSRLY